MKGMRQIKRLSPPFYMVQGEGETGSFPPAYRVWLDGGRGFFSAGATKSLDVPVLQDGATRMVEDITDRA